MVTSSKPRLVKPSKGGATDTSLAMIKESTTKKRDADDEETGSGQDAGEIAKALTPDDEHLAEQEG